MMRPMKLTRSLWTRLDRLYGGESYFIRQKAFIFIILLANWIIWEIGSLVLNSLASLQSNHNVTVFFTIITIAIATVMILLTLLGHYRRASIMTCVLFAVGLVIFSLFRMNLFVQFGVNPAVVLGALVIAFSSFFVERKIFVAIAIPLVLCHIALIIAGPYYVRPEAMTSFFSFNVSLSLTLIGLLAFFYFTSELVNKALERADLEIRKNREFSHLLETKVDSRTHDLALAMRELESSNDELTRTRNSLWGEMKIAKKLQTLLIPQQPAVDGYQTAAYIKPASDVGGDYYDVINKKDNDWIVMGDVSGHGVPAGLVMMMVHIAIHSVLASRDDNTPAKVLSQVNGVVAEYMHRIDHSKYMTINLLMHQGNGRFLHSGLHLPILVYRREKNAVEEIDTCGTWIGLNFDIGTDFCDSELTLDIGDIMLLYTDGITESWITHETEGMEEAALHFFGQDTLSKILLEEKDNSADGIRTRIIDELSIYDQRDDVTFLLMKRMS